MTVKEICNLIEETKVVLFERGRAFDDSVAEFEAGEPIFEKYADREVFQMESVVEKDDGVIYLLIGK